MLAESIASNIDYAIFAKLRRIASEKGIPPLRWQILPDSEVVVLEGIPEPGGDPAASAHWARALGMSSYEFEAREGAQCWFLNVGPWVIEVRSPPPASDG